jgi:class 3 adenylate cyclase
MRPETRYAKSGDLHIAYEILGKGPPDLVYVPEFWNSMEAQWEEPSFARFLERLGSFSRLITFDNRGTGLSDPVPLNDLPRLEQFMDDVRAVMDASQSERAALFCTGGGSLVSLLFATTYPDRVSALVIANGYSRLGRADDYPWGALPENDAVLQRIRESWGRGGLIDTVAPSMTGDDRFRQWWARYERLGLSPGAAVAMRQMLLAADTRHLLPLVQIPTLVLHRTDNRLLDVGHARYLKEHIAGAKYVELPGEDHLIFVGDQELVLDETREFVTGVRGVSEPDRVLATVLFTDIVRSTERATELGDRQWRNLLDTHDATVRRQLERFQGREVDTTGDGFVATFDGPARAISAACAIRDASRQIGLEIRAGVHTGELYLRGDDIAGLAVHIAARVAQKASPNQVLVSSTVKDLVAGSGIEFLYRGMHSLKGVQDRWRLFEVQGP